MKKIVILFLSIMTIGLSVTSCSKDDNTPKTPSLKGTWEYSKSGVSIGGEEFLDNWEHAVGCSKDHMEFLNDGKLKDVSYDGANQCAENVTDGTYVKVDDKLTLNFGGEEIVTTIMTLSATELKVSFEDQGLTGIVLFVRK